MLAGWLPQGGAQLMRALAGWFEIANVAERLAELAGRQSGADLPAGRAGDRLAAAAAGGHAAELRSVLAASAWKDPGGDTAARPGGRAAGQMGAAGRGTRRARPDLGGQRAGAAAGRRAVRRGTGRDTRCSGRSPPPCSARRAAAAGTPGELARRLPGRLSWVLERVADPADLWRAEAAWWTRTERDGRELLAGSGLDQRPVLGAAVVLAADARRVGAALEIAARGGGPMGVFDAVA